MRYLCNSYIQSVNLDITCCLAKGYDEILTRHTSTSLNIMDQSGFWILLICNSDHHTK